MTCVAPALQRRSNELREDALTTDLGVRVDVRDGVAILTGQVADLADADAAEEVAGRVAGIKEVMDRTEIAD